MSRRRTSVLTLVVAAAAVSTAAVGTITAPAHADRRSPRAPCRSGCRTPDRGQRDHPGPRRPARARPPGPQRPHRDPRGQAPGRDRLHRRSARRCPVRAAASASRWRRRSPPATAGSTPATTDARPTKSGTARVVIVADQHHGHRINTSLSIRAAHRVAQADGRDLVRGRLRTHGIGLRGRVVDLVTRTAADPTWRVIGQDLSDRGGAVQFPITADRSRRRTGWSSTAPPCSATRTAASCGSGSGRS